MTSVPFSSANGPANQKVKARFMKSVSFLTALPFALSLLASGHASANDAAGDVAGEVNVYSYRQPNLVQPLFDGFSAKTGIRGDTGFAIKGGRGVIVGGGGKGWGRALGWC